MDLPLWVAIPVVALFIPIAAIIMDGWQKMKEREHVHAERIKALELGKADVLPSWTASLVEPPKKPHSAGYHGAVWAGLGGGLLVSTMFVRTTGHDDLIKFADFLMLWSFPALCLGLGLLIYAWVSRQSKAGTE